MYVSTERVTFMSSACDPRERTLTKWKPKTLETLEHFHPRLKVQVVFFSCMSHRDNIFVAPISVLYASIPDQQQTTEPSLASPSASHGSRRPTPSHHWTQAPQSQRSPSPATIAAPASSRFPTWTVKVALTVPCERRALTSIWQDG